MAAYSPGRASWGLSALLHVGLGLVLWYASVAETPQMPPPLSVELWAGGGVRATPAPTPVSAPPRAVAPPPAAAPAPQAVVPPLAAADVTLKANKPLPPAPAPSSVAPPAVKPLPAVKPAPAAASTKVPPAKAAANPASVATEDLLAELDTLPPGPGKGKVTQAGGKQGVTSGGSPSGVADQRAQYIDAVRTRIRPYVMVPDGIKGNPEAVVEVDLLPTLEIRQSRLLRSSGVPAYDQAVLDALRDAGRFPPLPKGAEFADYRRITLKFRPRE